MRKAGVYRNGELAGSLLEESPDKYVFVYEDKYYLDREKPAISLTLPKVKKEYNSTYLFPFFYNMLSEGHNKKLQNRHLHIDENDDFGLLLATANHDTIGPISVKKMD